MDICKVNPCTLQVHAFQVAAADAVTADVQVDDSSTVADVKNKIELITGKGDVTNLSSTPHWSAPRHFAFAFQTPLLCNSALFVVLYLSQGTKGKVGQLLLRMPRQTMVMLAKGLSATAATTSLVVLQASPHLPKD